MAGLPWFKLYGDFFSHPKTLELQAELGDPCADVYVVRLWAYVSRVAASGRVAGRNAVTVLEKAVAWQGEPGRLVASLVRVGFLEQEPDTLVVHDWTREQGAHVAKVEKDRARAPARLRMSDKHPVPARELRGNVAGSREIPGVEREIEREIEIPPSVGAASPVAAVAQPEGHPGDDLPDATEDAQEVRPALVLEAQAPKKPGRKPSAGEALYARLEARRQEACRIDGVPFVESRWAFSRQNKELGPLAKAEKTDAEGETWRRFVGAWVAFMEDDEAGKLDVPYSLDYFWRMRSRYEGRALKGAA